MRNCKKHDYSQVKALYASGLGMKAIAKRLGTWPSTIRGILKREGVASRSMAESNNDPMAKIRKLAARGVAIRREVILGVKKKKQKTGISGLELFEHAAQARKKNYVRSGKGEAEAKRKAAAMDKGFKSVYHERYSTDLDFRMKELYKRRFQKVVSTVGHGSRRMLGLIGCTKGELRDWIESQFEPWMTWDNNGKAKRGNWQIDHIIPCAWFDFSKPEHLEICWNYLNLRPLCAVKNIQKSDTTDGVIDAINALPGCQMKERMLSFCSSHYNSHK